MKETKSNLSFLRDFFPILKKSTTVFATMRKKDSKTNPAR